MNNFKVIVLEGGFNEEHLVSMKTSREVKKSLSNLNIEFISLTVNPVTFEEDIKKFKKNFICFNALHGTFGEDGEIQKILDKNGFKYTHSNSKSSYMGFNKEVTKNKLKELKILTPKYLILNYHEIDIDTLLLIFKKLGPFIMKPVSSGSSFGIKIFKNKKSIVTFSENLINNIQIYKNHNKLIFEEFIEGRELTVAVIEEKGISTPLEVTEIISQNEFFDYDSKYTPGYSKHILPAQIPKQVYEKCKLYSKMLHDKIKCKSISRSDFIYSNDRIYFIEINTQPGLTPISLVPEQLKYQNMSFDMMILAIIKSIL